MTTAKKTAIIVGALILVIATFVVLSPAQKRAAPVVLSFTDVYTSSNSSLVLMEISNASSGTINYTIGDADLKSHVVWDTPSFSWGITMDQLRAGQSSPRLVTVSATNGEARIPVLWGFQYSPGPQSKWRQWIEDAVAFFRMHDFRGRGALYTNYVEGIQLK